MDKKTKAKAVKIEDLYPYKSELRRFGSKLRGRCPFHDDKEEPNFFIYTETNTWYCFKGCGGGDSIQFFIKFHNVSFKEALKKMI